MGRFQKKCIAKLCQLLIAILKGKQMFKRRANNKLKEKSILFLRKKKLNAKTCLQSTMEIKLQRQKKKTLKIHWSQPGISHSHALLSS